MTGLVKRPGAYSMNALGRFATALSLAGGPLPEGSLRQISLSQGATTRTIDWMKFVRKGDTAQNATKPAVLETGHTVQVPLFVEQGDVIRVDTRTGQYIERVQK